MYSVNYKEQASKLGNKCFNKTGFSLCNKLVKNLDLSTRKYLKYSYHKFKCFREFTTGVYYDTIAMHYV